MNPQVKAKWLKALRSGEYRQTRCLLRSSNDAFCCLGVLCDIYTDEVEGSWEFDGYDKDGYTMINHNKGQHSKMELPACVAEWAGLEECNPEVFIGGNPNSFSTLSGLNDEGKTFNEIADLIDRHL